MLINKNKVVDRGPEQPIADIPRRAFLQYAGLLVLASTVLACNKDEEQHGNPQINDGNTIDFKNDTGVFNYLYALEQLEAAFYNNVVENFALTFSDQQKTFLREIRLHEIAHREFFKKFLGYAGLTNLEFDFTSIDFNNRDAVLEAAKTFEDLGVAAYNGAILKCTESSSVMIMSQLVSVEARHSAWIREQVTSDSFGDLDELSTFGASAGNGLDVLQSPEAVLSRIAKYIRTSLNVVNL